MWVKLDDGFAEHPKIARVGAGAYRWRRFVEQARVPALRAAVVALDRVHVPQPTAGVSGGAGREGEPMNDAIRRTQRRYDYEDFREIIADYIERENAAGRYVAVAQVVNLAEVLHPDCDPAMVLVDVHDLLEERGSLTT